MFITIFLEIFM